MAIEVIWVLDAQSGLPVAVKADQIGTDYAQVVKVAHGADGTLTLAETAAPLPVVQTGALPAGSALIGQFDANSIPASSRTTDSNSTAETVDVLMNNLTALTVKKAFANVTASSTDSNIVSAVASKSIRVISFRLHVGGTATTVTFNSKPAGAGTAISETFACGANGGREGSYHPKGHFWTTAGEGLTVTTGAGSTTGVGVTYVEV